MKELQHLNKYLKKYRYKLLIGVLITILAKTFALFTPRLIGQAINVIADSLNGDLTYAEFKPKIFFKIVLVIAAAIIAGIFTFLKRQTIINVSRFIEFDLKNEVYEQYQRLSLNFYKKNRTGDLMNRISEDVGKVRMYVGPALMYSIDTITLFVIAIIYMFNQSPTLTLYTIIPLPILSIAIYTLSRIIHKRSTVVQLYLSKLSSYAQESFSGIFIIKANGLEAQTNYAFETLSTESREKQIDLTKVQAFFFPLMILLIGTSNLFVIYIGGMQYINGEIEIGTIVEFIIYVNMLTWPVAALGWVTSIVQQAEASQKRINEFLKEEPEIRNTVNHPTEIKGNIEFRNIFFTYDDTNIQALKGVSFKVNQGETLYGR